jgi:3-deoxy-7-phosphoheptulonate synthase
MSPKEVSSFFVDLDQVLNVNQGPAGLKYGVSITDACVDWEMTVDMLNRLDQVSYTLIPVGAFTENLAKAVKQRRSTVIEAGLKKPPVYVHED